jgi:endonuclease/exonuclease/phosphatase family metal-dependent hydrolase
MLNDFQSGLELDRVYLKGLPPGPHVPDAARLRVLSWNIEHGHRPERIAQVLNEVTPDIACLQEVDWNVARSGSRDVLAELAAATGMTGLYAIAFYELASPRRSARRQGGGVVGNALLSRLAPQRYFAISLPAVFDLTRAEGNERLPPWVRWIVSREPRRGRRGGLGAVFVVGGRSLVVASVHLENKQCGVAGRWTQYRAALDAVEAHAGPDAVRVIAGDLNTFDCSLARRYTRERDAEACGKPAGMIEAEWWKLSLLPPTGYADPFPADAGTFQVTPFFRPKLDWITVRGAAVRAHGIGPFASSDHRPVWADLDLTLGRSAGFQPAHGGV